MNPNTIKQLIEAGLKDCVAMIDGDDGQHFTAIVICPVFAGKNRVQKQQLVYATLESYIKDGSLHAISFKTYTPEEWQSQTK
jgi:acid stress-induced BolA-like protein IbaG/YrbA